jgi:hypothetical protein
MPVFHVKNCDGVQGVIAGHNAADAVLKYDTHFDADGQDERIREHDDSINAYCEVLLAEHEVTELYRAEVLEWVERRLDGMNVVVLL